MNECVLLHNHLAVGEWARVPCLPRRGTPPVDIPSDIDEDKLN